MAKRPIAAARQPIAGPEGPLAQRQLQGHETQDDAPEQAAAPPAIVTTQIDVVRASEASFEALETPEVGLDIDHFRVLRTIGRGGMGRVLLARDTRLGRLVALKVLREDRFDSERALALMVEARVIARISHQNIVTIFFVGRWRNAPYLALEYVDGVTLRQRLNQAPPTPKEALRAVLSIARALEAAHAAAVIHCDLKPENVLLPHDGRLRVVDFGIARVAETWTSARGGADPGRIAGTPGYMAPEQWLGEAPTGATDIWALGVILFELLAGYRPFESPSADARPLRMRVLDERCVPRPPAGLEADLHVLLAAMLHRDPEQRPTAGDVAVRMERMLARSDQGDREGEAPFRGLLSFEERHAPFFFGRDAEVDAVVERLRSTTILPLVGPSGAGKSSLFQAGIVPRLREQGPWTVIAMRPGLRPLHALAARLLAHEGTDSSRMIAPNQDAVAALASELRAHPGLGNVYLHRLAEQTHTRVLLFVDQLEEVVTHGAQHDEAGIFLDAVAQAADPVDDLVRVVFTLRDDFLGRVAIGDAMAAVLGNVVVVRRLTGAHLRDAAARPLEQLGYAWDDPHVIERMVKELLDQPAALPLLQFACAAVWERRDRSARQLRRADYEALGGVAGALAAHAEAVFDGLAGQDVAVARRLLLRLVAPDGTRLAVKRADALAGLSARGEAVLERLTHARLLTVRRAREAEDSLLELAHESLVRTWPQLARWLDESSEERLCATEVEQAAQLWHKRGRRQEEVWPLDGARDARRRLRTEQDSLSAVGTAFLTASEAQGLRRRRRRRTVAAVLTGLGIAVTVASVLMAAEWRRRERTAKHQTAQIALAAADLGLVQLDLELVDWDPRLRAAHGVDAAQFPQLNVQVLDADPLDPHQPGAPRNPRFVRASVPRLRARLWQQTLETRSGPAFLRVSGRGAAGQTCPASLLALHNVPGFEARQRGPTVLHATVPTCAATAADTILIPGGPFVFGGPGEPLIAAQVTPPPERQVDLAPFRIDRTEAPNALYALFARNERLTGEGVPDYPPDDLVQGAARPDHPVTGLDAFAAAAFCAWQGKHLPSTEQWTKAARGGLTLDVVAGQLNPTPRRSLPWGEGRVKGRVNLLDDTDGWPHSAPVDAFPAGASPYGVLGMADNVSEWTHSMADASASRALRIIRGANWGMAEADGMHTTGVENHRTAKYFNFALGCRCVLDSTR